MEEQKLMPGDSCPEESPFLHPEVPRSLPDWEELLSSGLRMAARLMAARRCALFLACINEEGLEELEMAGAWDEVDGVVLADPTLFDNALGRCGIGETASATALQPDTKWCGRDGTTTSLMPHLCACAPLHLGDRRYGVLEVARSAQSGPFGEREMESLQLAADHLAVCLRNSSTHLGLRRLADTDGLTGVFNFRRFQMQMEIEVARCDRHGRPLSLMMLDLNNFKRYNDRFGHQHGDIALRMIAATLQHAVRRIDVVARYGGDEFAVILPETGPAQALIVARRIEQAVRENSATMPCPGAAECLAVSIGISSYPTLAASKQELIAQADEALYRSKRLRGEPVRVWQEDWRKTAKKQLHHMGDPDLRLRLFDVLPH